MYVFHVGLIFFLNWDHTFYKHSIENTTQRTKETTGQLIIIVEFLSLSL